jgi:hypothetical protein
MALLVPEPLKEDKTDTELRVLKEQFLIVGHVTQLCDMMESNLEAWSFGCVCRLGTLGLA